MKPEFSRYIFKTINISNFMKIRPVGVKLFHADRQKEIDMTTLVIAFRNFANAPKKLKNIKFQALDPKSSLSSGYLLKKISDKETGQALL